MLPLDAADANSYKSREQLDKFLEDETIRSY